MSKRQRIVVSCLIVWTFIHTFFLIAGYYEGEKDRFDKFFPFMSWRNYFSDMIRYYDFSEFFIYMGGAWMTFYLYRFINNKK